MQPSRAPVSIALLAFLVAFTGAVTPGSMLALVIGQVLAHGMPAVFMILLGHALLEALFLVGFSYGLARFLDRKLTRGVLALVGGTIMALMGIDIVVHASAMSLSGGSTRQFSLFFLIPAGAAFSISNPYFTGWWATVGSGQVAAFGLRHVRQYVAFWIGHEMGDVAWYVFVAGVLVFGRQWLSDTIYQGLLAVCGYVMCALALVFFFAGLVLCTQSNGAPAVSDGACNNPC